MPKKSCSFFESALFALFFVASISHTEKKGVRRNQKWFREMKKGFVENKHALKMFF
jgi:hypothetical protein